MVKKFVRIKQVGTFVDYSASGDVELGKLTLIQADNGRGKTTLCEILRSLGTANPSYITGRTSLGSTQTPMVTVRLEGDNRTFIDGRWDQAHPHITIFDEAFVHENVYAGDTIEHEHRKNLYYVIIGATGATLARRVDKLDTQIRDFNRELSSRQDAVKALVPQGISLDEFVQLPADGAIAEKLNAKEAELRAAERSAEISGQPALEPLQFPLLPPDLDTMLARTLDDVQRDAETLVRKHMALHNAVGFEQWLSRGTSYATSAECPFCGQNITGSRLIEAYRGYFSQRYEALKGELQALHSLVDESFSDAAILRLQQRISANINLGQFWKNFTDATIPEVDIARVEAGIRDFRTAALACLAEKSAAPLESRAASPQLNAARVLLEQASPEIAHYNARLETVNTQIAAVKQGAAAANLVALKTDLDRLRAVRLRHVDPAAGVCGAYLQARQDKQSLEREKDRAKGQLDSHAKRVFAECQTGINTLLERFGAGFRIGDVKTRYAGGTPSSSFRIIINRVPVELGDSKTQRDVPSFRNTLSAGDRRALALALFLTQLNQDPDLGRKTVVFDDPFNSLDKTRRSCTRDEIRRLFDTAEQVVVLSHDANFLRLLYDAVPSAYTKALQLRREGQHTVILPMDIEAATREEYFQNYDTLREYITTGSGEPVHVARCIRPLLEKYYRMKFPRDFSSNEWLGDFVRKVRDADPGSSLAALQQTLPEIEAIKDYSKPYHHDGGPPVMPGPPDHAELEVFARRTLKLIEGT